MCVVCGVLAQIQDSDSYPAPVNYRVALPSCNWFERCLNESRTQVNNVRDVMGHGCSAVVLHLLSRLDIKVII